MYVKKSNNTDVWVRFHITHVPNAHFIKHKKYSWRVLFVLAKFRSFLFCFAAFAKVEFLLSFIATHAIGAIIIRVLSAAVAAIPVASAEVVHVVAVSIANETDDFAIFVAVRLALSFWVLASAQLAAILLAV